MRLVLVEWDDTCSGTTWMSRGESESAEKIVSVGILVEENDRQIEIIPNINIAHKLHQIAIPRGCIRRMRKLHV